MKELLRSELKTGTIVEITTERTGTVQMAMVLLDTERGDIVSGETWCPLESLFKGDASTQTITKAWLPRSNMAYLNGGINTDHCALIWEAPDPKVLRIAELKEEIRKARFELAGLDSERLTEIVTDLWRNGGNFLHIGMAERNNKVACIKWYRGETGMGLRDAKQKVEEIIDKAESHW